MCNDKTMEKAHRIMMNYNGLIGNGVEFYSSRIFGTCEAIAIMVR
jgi:FKBP-type peptidyl-prolyl cis-trans isomerase